jgi:hypothetical protein
VNVTYILGCATADRIESKTIRSTGVNGAILAALSLQNSGAEATEFADCDKLAAIADFA